MDKVKQNKDTAAIIIGGGIVGLMTAALVAKEGCRVIIVERRAPTFDWSPSSIDIRVSAITRESQNLFQHLGLWQGLSELGVSPYQHMCVWDEGGPGEIHFDARDVGQPNIGHIVENRLMHKVLFQHLSDQESVEFVFDDAPIGYQIQQSGVSLTLDSGKELSAQVLVGADGARSWLRQQAGIDTKGWSYQQKALVATVETEKPHQKTAWQRFLPTGPIAFLPLSEQHLSSIVWSYTPESVDALLSLEQEQQKRAIAKALGFRLGKVTDIHQVAAFPLNMQHAERYIAERVVCVGDAIHSIHPLAGQGLNLGLQDAKSLAACFAAAHQQGRDLGARSLLRRYERARKAPVLGTIALMEAFKRGFQAQQLPIRFLRNQGLQLSNRLLPVKQFFIKKAMGL